MCTRNWVAWRVRIIQMSKDWTKSVSGSRKEWGGPIGGRPVLPLAPPLSSAGCGLSGSGCGSPEMGAAGAMEGPADTRSGAFSQPKLLSQTF